MQEIYTSINTSSDWSTVIFTCLFSLGIAIFYALIIEAFYKEGLPRWLFFVLFPLIIVASKLILDINVLSIIIFLFVFLIILFFIAIIFNTIKSIVVTIVRRSETEETSSMIFSIIKDTLLVALAIAGFIFLSPIVVFVAIFLIIAVRSFIKFNNNKKNNNKGNKEERLQSSERIRIFRKELKSLSRRISSLRSDRNELVALHHKWSHDHAHTH